MRFRYRKIFPAFSTVYISISSYVFLTCAPALFTY